jgi:hypothetical protein
VTDRSAASPIWPPHVAGLAQWGHRIFRGEDPVLLIQEVEARVAVDPADAGAWFDLGILHELSLDPERGLACQARALELSRVFRTPAPREPALSLLMFVAPGDIATNVPVSFLLLDSDVNLDMAFLLPNGPLPEEVPDHDLAMIGACQSTANEPVLAQLDEVLPDWPRPFLLSTSAIRSMERDRLWQLMSGAPGVLIPPTVLLDRDQLGALATGDTAIPGLDQLATCPYLLRPLDSHGGHGLERIDAPADVAPYLERHPAEQFFWAPFIDYRGADGLFRKYRIVLMDGKPFLCHVAIAAHWMLHYLNAGMDVDAAKRAEEAQAFATFDEAFATRHAAALRALYERTESEYITIDCAETPGGELLIFEAGTAMVVHDMDPPDLFPYKGPNMDRVFAAFRELLERRARGSPRS